VATFTITGVREIRRAFELLPKRVANKVIRQGIRKALRPMKARVEALAPRHTGKTARSVKIRARPNRRRGQIAVDVQIGEGAYRGTTFYAAFPEFGTSRQPAQHYMERAFNETEDQARSVAADEIAAGTAREWKSL
jgi:HK97 gp10 family phage protein